MSTVTAKGALPLAHDSLEVAIASHVADQYHGGAYATSQGEWLARGKFYPTTDPCRDGSDCGCATAAQLRVMRLALAKFAWHTTVTVLTADAEVAALVAQWRAGDTDKPSWYVPDFRPEKPAALYRLQHRVLQDAEIAVRYVEPAHPLVALVLPLARRACLATRFRKRKNDTELQLAGARRMQEYAKAQGVA